MPLMIHRTQRLGARVLRYWNWKAAVCCGVIRALLFLGLTWHSGWRQAGLSTLTEGGFRLVTAGFYGAITQALSDLQPTWLAVGSVTVLLPLFAQGVDSLLHIGCGTPHLVLGTVIYLGFYAYGSLFDWYAMRHGALLTGPQSSSVRADLRALPGIYLRFLSKPLDWAAMLWPNESNSPEDEPCAPSEVCAEQEGP
jgi:hypothetical protein